MKYDPLSTPDPDTWLGTPETERLRAIESYHRIAGTRIGNLQLHAALHGVVENQLALHDPAAQDALTRLLREGLDRHEAMHAIASVLAQHIFTAMHGGEAPATDYTEALATLTAASWRKSGKR